MRNIDLSPLYRSMIGFDRMATLLDSAARNGQSQPSYPPYNIEQLEEDKYLITMAVAGFEEQELNLISENNTLTVEGKKESDQVEHKYLHQGIAARNFKHRFQLAEHVKVTAAEMKNGLLHIALVREIPEAMKPKKIQITSSQVSPKLTDVNAA